MGVVMEPYGTAKTRLSGALGSAENVSGRSRSRETPFCSGPRQLYHHTVLPPPAPAPPPAFFLGSSSSAAVEASAALALMGFVQPPESSDRGSRRRNGTRKCLMRSAS